MSIKKKSLIDAGAKRKGGGRGPATPTSDPAAPAGMAAGKRLAMAKLATAKLSTARLLTLKKLS